jgi:hypothetical protein
MRKSADACHEQARFDGGLSVRDGVIYPSESRRKTALDSEHKGALEISQRPHSLVWVSDEQVLEINCFPRVVGLVSSLALTPAWVFLESRAIYDQRLLLCVLVCVVLVCV